MKEKCRFFKDWQLAISTKTALSKQAKVTDRSCEVIQTLIFALVKVAVATCKRETERALFLKNPATRPRLDLISAHCMLKLLQVARFYLLLAAAGPGHRGVMAWRSHGSSNDDLLKQLKSE